MRRHVRAILAVLCWMTASCRAGAVAPRDGGADVEVSGVTSMRVTVAAASMTEADSPPGEHLRLELEIANTGDIPIDHVGVLDASFALSGISLPAYFTPDPPPSVPPILPGETRTVAFQDDLDSLGACVAQVRERPNPHQGLVTLGFQLVTATSGVVFSGVSVDSTCASGPPTPTPVPCPDSLDGVCAAPDVPGMLGIHCSPTWMAVADDHYYCDTTILTVLEDQADCSDGFEARVVQDANTVYTYYYDVASGTLAAITLASRVAPPGTPAGCVAGPSVFVPPICFGFRSLAGRCAPTPVDAGALPDGATHERPGP